VIRGTSVGNVPTATAEIGGVLLYREFLAPPAQAKMLEAIRDVVRAAPLFAPRTPGGRPMSVRMTAAGRYGWITDAAGYRYEPRHPSGHDWPAIPDCVLAVWAAVAGTTRMPDCCLINFYGEGARMGLHQDRDEADFGQPVVSVSLGDPALFRVGGTGRRDPTRSVWLHSGDVAVLAGPARLAYHGIDRIRFGASGLLAQGGRINLTLRVVT